MSTDSEIPPRWQLVVAHRSRLLRMARRRTVSEHDAEDVVAEAMLRAVERPEVDEDRLPAWLTVVTVRLCLDIERERARERRRWARADVALVAGSCEQGVCDRAEAAWAAEHVAALPSRQARALRLRAAGMDVAGIAQTLGVTYRTAESLLARGRATVRATLSTTWAAAAVLAAYRWLRSTVSSAGGGVAATAAMSVAGVAAVVTVMLGPSSPDAAAPARTAPEATDETTAPPHPSGTAEVPPPAPTTVPPTAPGSAPAETSPQRDVPPATTTTVPAPLPAPLPTNLPAPNLAPPITPPQLPVAVPDLSVPAAVPSLLPTLIPNPG